MIRLTILIFINILMATEYVYANGGAIVVIMNQQKQSLSAALEQKNKPGSFGDIKEILNGRIYMQKSSRRYKAGIESLTFYKMDRENNTKEERSGALLCDGSRDSANPVFVWVKPDNDFESLFHLTYPKCIEFMKCINKLSNLKLGTFIDFHPIVSIDNHNYLNHIHLPELCFD